MLRQPLEGRAPQFAAAPAPPPASPLLLANSSNSRRACARRPAYARPCERTACRRPPSWQAWRAACAPRAGVDLLLAVVRHVVHETRDQRVCHQPRSGLAVVHDLRSHWLLHQRRQNRQAQAERRSGTAAGGRPGGARKRCTATAPVPVLVPERGRVIWSGQPTTRWRTRGAGCSNRSACCWSVRMHFASMGTVGFKLGLSS